MLADEHRQILALEGRAIDLTVELGRLMAGAARPGPLQERLRQRLWAELDRTRAELEAVQDRILLLGVPSGLRWLMQGKGSATPPDGATIH